MTFISDLIIYLPCVLVTSVLASINLDKKAQDIYWGWTTFPLAASLVLYLIIYGCSYYSYLQKKYDEEHKLLEERENENNTRKFGSNDQSNLITSDIIDDKEYDPQIFGGGWLPFVYSKDKYANFRNLILWMFVTLIPWIVSVAYPETDYTNVPVIYVILILIWNVIILLFLLQKLVGNRHFRDHSFKAIHVVKSKLKSSKNIVFRPLDTNLKNLFREISYQVYSEEQPQNISELKSTDSIRYDNQTKNLLFGSSTGVAPKQEELISEDSSDKYVQEPIFEISSDSHSSLYKKLDEYNSFSDDFEGIPPQGIPLGSKMLNSLDAKIAEAEKERFNSSYSRTSPFSTEENDTSVSSIRKYYMIKQCKIFVLIYTLVISIALTGSYLTHDILILQKTFIIISAIFAFFTFLTIVKTGFKIVWILAWILFVVSYILISIMVYDASAQLNWRRTFIPIYFFEIYLWIICISLKIA